MAATLASLRVLQSSSHFFSGPPRRRPAPAHAALEQVLQRAPLCRNLINRPGRHQPPLRRSPLIQQAPPVLLTKRNAVSPVSRESSNYTRSSPRKVRRCVAASAAGVAVAADFQNQGSEPAIAHTLSDELPVRLPPPPSDSSILSIFPYLWKLATADKSLRWRVAVSLILLVGGKVRARDSGPATFKWVVCKSLCISIGHLERTCENFGALL